MFDRVAVVGDADTVFPLRVMGMKVFSPKNLEEAREIMKALELENIALCFLQEDLFEPLEKEREALRKKFCPVVVGFSDHKKVTDHIEREMRDLSIKATGSDSLVKKRGQDEAR